MAQAAPLPAPPDSPARPNWAIIVRAVVFLAVGYITLRLIAALLYPVFGLLIASVVGGLIGAVAANLISIRVYERGTLADIGLRWTPASVRHVAIGFACGAGAAAIVLGAPLAAGLAYLEPVAGESGGPGTLAFLTTIIALGAISEEMLFRGYGFQVLVPALGSFGTIFPLAALFGLAHMANLNASPLSVLNTFAWGAILGWAVLRSGDLWLAIGLHAGWNWMLPLFGAEVSGFKLGLMGHAIRWRLDPIWSGGAYGPEGGLLCSLVLVLLTYVLLRAPIRRQELMLARIPAQPSA